MAVGLPILAAPPKTVALVGNPNAGKTSLFNALTGLRAKTGNYPGTTVDVRSGPVTLVGAEGETLTATAVDLPGLYGLDPLSPEEEVTAAVLRGEAEGGAPDAVLLAVDAARLQRNLSLATEVLALGLPTVVALTFQDEARRQGLEVDIEGLAERLGCPVVPASGRTGEGLPGLREALEEVVSGDCPVTSQGRPTCGVGCAGCAFSDRFEWAERVVGETVRGLRPEQPPPTRLDRVLTHPLAGVLAFAGLMLAVFWAIFSLAGVPMDLIDGAFGAASEWAGSLVPEIEATPWWRAGVFAAGFAAGAAALALDKGKPTWRGWTLVSLAAAGAASLSVEDFRSLLTDGVIGGVGGVVIFLPQIAILFFAISLLEDSGYMARAAFVMERLMRAVGLPGKAFVPMLSAHACAIPGIMGTRVIEDRRDRLATIFVIPLLTCSARLPVYAMVTALLFGGRPLMAALTFTGAYVLGIAAALGTAWLLKRSVLPGEAVPLVLELPPLRRPSLRNAGVAVWEASRMFLRRAGSVILLISVVLWGLTNFPRTSAEPPAEVAAAGEAEIDAWASQARLENSYAGRLGKAVEPVFAPLGFDWKINVGVLASFAAREVIVSTLAIVYSASEEAAEDEGTLVETLERQRRDDGSKVYTTATCLSLLVFYVLAMQCLPTQVVTAKETGRWGWAIGQLVYMTLLAWAAGAATHAAVTALS